MVMKAVLAAVALAVAVGGCSSTPDPAQSRITNPSRPNSVNASLGSIRLLATRIEAPSDLAHTVGGNVGLFTTLANDGDAPDQLLGVSTVYARHVVFKAGLDSPAGPVSVDVPARGVASMQYPGGPHLEMVDLKVDVAGGRFLPVTFRFSTGSVTVDVFVEGFGLPTVSPLGSTSS
jgi:periplasmic copper chaperone A